MTPHLDQPEEQQERPLVLVDVDGVLNALGPPVEGTPWQTGSAVAEGRAYPIRWSRPVVERVLGWTELADVQWLTTWGHDANTSLRHLLALPELPVAGTHDGAGDDGSAPAAPSHAAVAPAAPDALTGRWWKLDVVRRLVLAAPDRPLVWLDDDLYGQDDVREWMEEHACALLLAPDPRTGLDDADLREVDAFLRERS